MSGDENCVDHHDLQETTSCRQWRSAQQQEVAEQPQEQVRGRTEAGRNPGQVAGQVQEVQVRRHGGGGGERQSPGGLLATRPKLPLRQPRGRHRHVQHQPLRGPHHRLWR